MIEMRLHGTIPENDDAIGGSGSQPTLKGGWLTVERSLLLLTFLSSVLAFTFGIGANWARIAVQEQTIKALQLNSVPREVYQSDQRFLVESINRLTRAIENLQHEGRTR